MKINKIETTSRILNIAGNNIRPCTKLEMQNIVFPKWSELGLFGKMFRQCVTTKEQPKGNIYDEKYWVTVWRLLNNETKELFIDGKLDVFAWKVSKFEETENKRPIGTTSPEAVKNLYEFIQNIESDEEKAQVEEFFRTIKKEFTLVITPPESRECIEVTQDLYDSGITHCVDQWMDEDENGMSEATELNVGDFLIVTNKGVYCIRGKEFNETHIFN